MRAIIWNGTDEVRHECLNVENIEIYKDGSCKVMHVGGKVPRLFSRVVKMTFELVDGIPPRQGLDRYQMEDARISALTTVFSRDSANVLEYCSEDELYLKEAVEVLRSNHAYAPTTDDGDIIRPLRRTLARIRNRAKESRRGGD